MTMIVKMNSLGHGQASKIINYPIILAIIIPYKCHINGQINEYNKEGRINIKKDRKMSIKVLTQIKILFIRILVFLPGICLSFFFWRKELLYCMLHLSTGYWSSFYLNTIKLVLCWKLSLSRYQIIKWIVHKLLVNISFGWF